MPRTPKGRGGAKQVTAEQVILVDNLSGGVDLNTAQSNLKPDQARRLSNWSLEEPGLLVTTEGYDLFSTTSLGAGRAQGGERVYTTSGAFTLVGFGGSVYKPSDGGVWGAAVLTGLHATNDIFFPYDRRIVFVCDSSNRPKMSKNGTTWYTMGIDAPTVAPTAALVAGGSLINGNTYEFGYTYATSSAFDADLVHEGNGSAKVQATPSGANLTVRLTVTYTTDAKVDTIYVYMRNVTTGQTVLRRKTSVANNTAGGSTTVDITTEVAETAVEIPTNHDVPLSFSFAIPWKNRLWARHPTTKNRIHFTQVFEPQTWPADFFIDLPMEKGDDVESEVNLGDVNVIFGQSGVFLIIGQTSLDFEVRPALSSETGAFGFRAATRVEAGVVHAGPPGVYLFDGASDRLLSQPIDKGWKQMVDTASTANLAKIDIAYHQPGKHIDVAVPIVYPTGSPGEWVLDLNRSRETERESWTSTPRTIGGYIQWDGHESTSGNVGRMFSWAIATGELFEEHAGTTADGGNFVAEYEGPVFTTQLRHAIAVHGFVEYEPATGNLAVEFVVDGKSQGIQTINLGAGQALYGSATYHVSTYAGASRKTQPLTFPLEAEGQNFLMKMVFTGTSRFRLLGYAFSLVAEPVISTI